MSDSQSVMSQSDGSQLRRSGRTRRPVLSQISQKDYGEWAKGEQPSEEEEEEPSSEEEAPKKRQKTERATKASKTKQKKRPAAAKKSTRKKPKRGKGKPLKRPTNTQYGYLMAYLLKKGTALLEVVEEWLGEYTREETRDAALLDITNLMIQSCGSLTSLTEEQLEEDREDLLEEIQEDMKDKDGSYPIESKSAVFSKFRSRLVEFWTKLVDTAKEGVLYDDIMMPHILDWLNCLSTSELRSFRHTSTVSVCAIVNSLVAVARDEYNGNDKTTHLLALELKKKKKSQSKIKQFNEQIAGHKEHLSAIDGILDDVFGRVFVHRYRDVFPAVRTLCLESLGEWMLGYPMFFLKDNYLKYVGWCLNDKDTAARKAALDVVFNLYKSGDEDVMQALELFSQRFLPRFSALTQDVDAKIAAQAINLLTELLKNERLTEEEGNNVPPYLWDKDPVVRKAAVRFVFEDTFQMEPDEGDRDENAAMEEDLVQLLNIFQTCCPIYLGDQEEVDTDEQMTIVQAHVAMLVNGFWPLLSCLKDWDVMASHLLLTEKEQREQRSKDVPDDTRQALLVFLLLACAVRATRKSDKMRKKEQVELKKVSEALTSYLVTHIDSLIAVFQADAIKMRCLAQLPRYMDVDQFAKQSNKKAYEKLLKLLIGAYQRHTDPLVLMELAKTFRQLAWTPNHFKDDAMAAVSKLASKNVASFVELTEQLSATPEDDDERLIAATACVNRIVHLYRMMPLKSLSFAEEFDTTLQKTLQESLTQEGTEHQAKLAAQLIDYYMLDLAWKQMQLDKTKPGAAAVERVASEYAKLSSLVFFALEEVTVHPILGRSAFRAAGDLFALFPRGLQGTPLKALAMTPSEGNKQLYLNYFARAMDLAMEEPTETTLLHLLTEASKPAVHDNVQHKDLAAAVVACLLKYGDQADAHIRAVMSALRAIGSSVLLDAQLGALIRVYGEGRVEGVEAAVDTLARRLLMSLPTFHRKVSMIQLLKGGVDFALQKPPDRFHFLTSALHPYVKRATKRDLNKLLPYWTELEEEVRKSKNRMLAEAEGDEEEGQEIAWAQLKLFQDQIEETLTKKGGGRYKPSQEDAPVVDPSSTRTERKKGLRLSLSPIALTPATGTGRSGRAGRARASARLNRPNSVSSAPRSTKPTKRTLHSIEHADDVQSEGEEKEEEEEAEEGEEGEEEEEEEGEGTPPDSAEKDGWSTKKSTRKIPPMLKESQNRRESRRSARSDSEATQSQSQPRRGKRRK